jgi:serine/threonine protein kinase
VWACGVVAFALLTARTPCWHEDDAEVLRQIVASSGSAALSLPDSVSPAAREFVRKALACDPAARPTAAELLATDPWLSSAGGNEVRPSPAPSLLPLPSASSLSGLEALIDDVLLGEGRRSARRQRRQQQEQEQQQQQRAAAVGGVVVAA